MAATLMYSPALSGVSCIHVHYESGFSARAFILQWTARGKKKLEFCKNVLQPVTADNCCVYVLYVIVCSHVLVWVIVRALSTAFSFFLFFSLQWLCMKSFYCAISHEATVGPIKATSNLGLSTHTHTHTHTHTETHLQIQMTDGPGLPSVNDKCHP